MSIPTLRKKNQVTIPAEFVTMAGFHVGEALEFDVSDGAIVIRAYAPQRHDEDWLTDEVIAEIEAATAAEPGDGFDSADDMIAALRRG